MSSLRNRVSDVVPISMGTEGEGTSLWVECRASDVEVGQRALRRAGVAGARAGSQLPSSIRPPPSHGIGGSQRDPAAGGLGLERRPGQGVGVGDGVVTIERTVTMKITSELVGIPEGQLDDGKLREPGGMTIRRTPPTRMPVTP